MGISGARARAAFSMARKIAARSASSIGRIAIPVIDGSPVTGSPDQVLVDGGRGDSARGDRAHREVRTQHRIAAGEDSGQVGGERPFDRPRCPRR